LAGETEVLEENLPQRQTGLLIDKKHKPKRQVLAEKLDDTEARLEHTPRKSLKRLALKRLECQILVQKTATQLLKLKPYKRKQVMPCSRAIQLAGFIFAVGFYNLSSKERSICN
jgi:hypothetical protein